MAYGGYNYGGYPGPGGYYAPPMPDQLAQLRGAPGQYQQPMNQPIMQNQMQPMQTAQPVIQQPQNTSSILWVSSEREAVEYPVAPNTAVALWDSNNPVVYLKKADASGKPDTEIYDLVKRNPAQVVSQPVQTAQVPAIEYVPRADFDALTARYDSLAAKYEAMAADLEALKNKPCRCAASAKKAKEAED